METRNTSTQNVDASGFKKWDGDKSPLLKAWKFRSALEEAIKIVEFGAKKYGDDNWRLCQEPERYLHACQRHLASHYEGEIFDPESGERHLAHALTSLMMYMCLEKKPNIEEVQELLGERRGSHGNTN
tara:strand:- start:10845 stop:11228 length:384 start_codon:yes stop_codon:yes gene_type:complete